MKQKIREQILYKRAKQSPRDKAPKDDAIIQHIENLPEFQKATNILMYVSIHGEVDLTKLFEKYKEEKKFILPRVNREDSTLLLYHIKSFKDLVKGTFNVSEPKENLEQIPPEKIEFAIIPGVAFALDGHRVGYGGGFYDRLLKKTSCPTIGIAYEFQIVENVPDEDHDEKVDIVITEDQATHTNSTP